MEGDRPGTGDRLHGLSRDRDRRARRHQAHLRRPLRAWRADPHGDGAHPPSGASVRSRRPESQDQSGNPQRHLAQAVGNLCFNPISALTHATLDVVATDPGTRMVSRKMMEEAERVARRRCGARARAADGPRIQGLSDIPRSHRGGRESALVDGGVIEQDRLSLNQIVPRSRFTSPIGRSRIAKRSG